MSGRVNTAKEVTRLRGELGGRPRDSAEGKAFIRALRLVTGGLGRLINVYEAARLLLWDDSDDNWAALERAVAEVGEVRDDGHPL